jgi:aspartyl-tRNA(Asn)/glutamyl-tRNA(Gln) amidotransferase subunit B
MPGALPVPNKIAVEWTIKIGKALNCTINKVTKFDRKHYFYPDLPKGYQISQYDEPIAVNGHIVIPSIVEGSPVEKKFRIHRVHLEEDTGKLNHSGKDSLVDFNRSSVPLVEIVTEADFDNSDDVKRFLEELHTIIKYLDVSDADMDKGSMRLEPNISVRKLPSVNPASSVIPAKAGIQGDRPGDEGFEYPPYKVEVKNINSFNFVKRAIDYEVVRQTEILEDGKIPTQETRGYNEDKGITVSQRSKEEAADYRYFPEPDIPPMVFEQKFIDSIEIPELPASKVARYVSDYKIKEQDAITLTRDKVISEKFEEIVSLCHPRDPSRLGRSEAESGDPLNRQMDSRSESGMTVTPQQIANLIVNRRIPTTISADEFVKRAVEQAAPKETNSAALGDAVRKVIAGNDKAVADFKSGKETVIMFLVGQVMREMRGKADANTVKDALIKTLK